MLKKLILVFLLAIMFSTTGCTYIPSTNAVHMVKSGNYIYIATTNLKGAHNDYVNVFETSNNNWKTVSFKGIDNPSIENMLKDNEGVIVELACNRKSKNGIYKINGKDEVTRFIELSCYESLAGNDDNYVYVVERKDLTDNVRKRSEIVYTGIKYDKNSKVRTNYHFDINPMLIVRDIWEDNNAFWYACFQEGTPRNYVTPYGTMVLVKKSKHNGKIDIFHLGEDIWEKDAKIIGDNDWIWIYRDKQFSDKDIIKFSIKDNAYKFIKIGYNQYTLFKSDKFYESDNFIWLLISTHDHEEVKIIKTDKLDAKYPSINFPDEIHTTSVICADKDFLWLDAYKMKGFTPSGNTTPYLLKVAKSDSSYEMFLVRPTIGAGSKTALENFLSWIFAPFLSQ